MSETIKIGDFVTVTNPQFVKRVGYPMDINEAFDTVVKSHLSRIRQFVNELFDNPSEISKQASNLGLVLKESNFLTNSERELCWALTKKYCAINNYGGNERTIHYHSPEKLQSYFDFCGGLENIVWEVVDKEIRKTGTRVVDYEIGNYLDNQKTHVIYTLVPHCDMFSLKKTNVCAVLPVERFKIEKSNVVKLHSHLDNFIKYSTDRKTKQTFSKLLNKRNETSRLINTSIYDGSKTIMDDDSSTGIKLWNYYILPQNELKLLVDKCSWFLNPCDIENTIHIGVEKIVVDARYTNRFDSHTISIDFLLKNNDIARYKICFYDNDKLYWFQREYFPATNDRRKQLRNDLLPENIQFTSSDNKRYVDMFGVNEKRQFIIQGDIVDAKFHNHDLDDAISQCLSSSIFNLALSIFGKEFSELSPIERNSLKLMI